MRMSTSSAPPCYLTAVLNDCYCEVAAYIVLAYSYWASFHNEYGDYTMPTKDIDYYSHIKAIELI